MKRFLVALFVSWAMTFTVGMTAAPAADPQTPSTLVSSLVHEAVTRLSAKDLSRANREQIIHGLLTQYTEEAQLAEHVLGRSWAAASPEDRSKFEDRFGAYMVAMCAGMLKDVPGDVKFVVKGEQPQGDRVVVHTAFVDSGGESTVVDWTVAHTGDGHLYLTDAASNGVSFIQTMASDFRAVLFANGGHIAALVAAMNKKIQVAAATD